MIFTYSWSDMHIYKFLLQRAVLAWYYKLRFILFKYSIRAECWHNVLFLCEKLCNCWLKHLEYVWLLKYRITLYWEWRINSNYQFNILFYQGWSIMNFIVLAKVYSGVNNVFICFCYISFFLCSSFLSSSMSQTLFNSKSQLVSCVGYCTPQQWFPFSLCTLTLHLMNLWPFWAIYSITFSISIFYTFISIHTFKCTALCSMQKNTIEK